MIGRLSASLVSLIALGAVAAIAIWIGLFGLSLSFKPFTTADVARLLGILALVALFVERTIEVSVGAWRGQVTERLFSAAESAKVALISAPSNVTLHETVAVRNAQLVDYRAQTKGFALRAGLALGLLVAATGFRTLETLVTSSGPGAAGALFRLLDLVMTAATIGGGSEAVHKMMSTITTYLDAASGQFRAREVEARSTAPVSLAVVPPLTAGPPAR
jgi:hypothetical protein